MDAIGVVILAVFHSFCHLVKIVFGAFLVRALNAAACRGVIACCGETYLRAVGQVERALHKAFAEGAAQRLVDDEFEKDGQNFEDWWAQSISDMVRVRLSAKEYLDPVEVSVEISKNDSGAYILSSEALAEIDRHIVSYPAD